MNKGFSVLNRICLVAAVGIAFSSCGGSKQEEVKYVSFDGISGEHAELLEVSDSVKVMLVNPSGDEWEVRALIPITNTMSWSDVPDTDPNAKEYYKPKMGNLSVEYLDKNGSELDCRVNPSWDVVESVLSSNKEKTENMSAHEMWGGGSYKDKKALFDKVASVKLSRAELSKVFSASTSSSSSSSSSASTSSSSSSSSWDIDDDDLDDLKKAAEISKKALEANKKAMKAAKSISSKSTKEAMDAYEKALDAYEDMLDF